MTKNCLNIVHIIYGAGPGSFGLGPVALNLVREQNRLGNNSALWCLDSESDRQWAAASCGLSNDKIRSFSVSPPSALLWSREMEKAAQLQLNDISVVHQHALWTGLSRITTNLNKRHGMPTIVTPHGSLEKWALRKSVWKKKIAMALYEKSNLHIASCLHACSEQEINGFRDFGLTNPIAVIPNGISNDWLESSGNADAFRSKFNIPADKRIMLFLSRISPVKGIPMLLDAMSTIGHVLNDWILVIAGSDECDHQKEVQENIRQLHLEKHVLLAGMLLGQTKRDAFEAAELFVLPTQRENYGIVVAEALGAGVPVVTTKGAPWECLETHHCGWWTNINSAAIADALADAAKCTADTLHHMGQRGKNMAGECCTWSNSARMTIELYEWLLRRRDKPDFVVVD